MPHTCESFWQMVWENNTEGIVMLNKIVEKNAVRVFNFYNACIHINFKISKNIKIRKK